MFLTGVVWCEVVESYTSGNEHILLCWLRPNVTRLTILKTLFKNEAQQSTTWLKNIIIGNNDSKCDLLVVN